MKEKWNFIQRNCYMIIAIVAVVFCLIGAFICTPGTAEAKGLEEFSISTDFAIDRTDVRATTVKNQQIKVLAEVGVTERFSLDYEGSTGFKDGKYTKVVANKFGFTAAAVQTNTWEVLVRPHTFVEMDFENKRWTLFDTVMITAEWRLRTQRKE